MSEETSNDQTRTEPTQPAPEERQEPVGFVKRRSRWLSALATLKYVDQAYALEAKTVRHSDRVTRTLLVGAIFAAALSLVVPAQLGVFIPLFDLFFGLALVFFITNRLGVLTMFTARQALLTWELILGCCVLGVYLTLNLDQAMAITFKMLKAFGSAQ